MDLSTEYIDMSREAKEIQELWEFRDGDYIEHKRNANCWSGYDAFDYPGYPLKEQGAVWLPRQDQLQDMLGDYYYTSSIMYYILEFGTDHDAPEPISWEKVWLEAVMWEKYQKTWNGETWVTA